MTREEKLRYVEEIHDALCQMCACYEGNDCEKCQFCRHISIGDRDATIISTADLETYQDVYAMSYEPRTEIGVMVVRGEPVAVYDGEIVRLGDAPANEVVEWSGAYDVISPEEWNALPRRRWNGKGWEEAL